MIVFRYLYLFIPIMLLLMGCQEDRCYEGYEGSGVKKITVNVPLFTKNIEKDPDDIWVDSGIDVTNGTKAFTLSINGTLDLCATENRTATTQQSIFESKYTCPSGSDEACRIFSVDADKYYLRDVVNIRSKDYQYSKAEKEKLIDRMYEPIIYDWYRRSNPKVSNNNERKKSYNRWTKDINYAKYRDWYKLYNFNYSDFNELSEFLKKVSLRDDYNLFPNFRKTLNDSPSKIKAIRDRLYKGLNGQSIFYIFDFVWIHLISKTAYLDTQMEFAKGDFAIFDLVPYKMGMGCDFVPEQPDYITELDSSDIQDSSGASTTFNNFCKVGGKIKIGGSFNAFPNVQSLVSNTLIYNSNLNSSASNKIYFNGKSTLWKNTALYDHKATLQNKKIDSTVDCNSSTAIQDFQMYDVNRHCKVIDYDPDNIQSFDFDKNVATITHKWSYNSTYKKDMIITDTSPFWKNSWAALLAAKFTDKNDLNVKFNSVGKWCFPDHASNKCADFNSSTGDIGLKLDYPYFIKDDSKLMLGIIGKSNYWDSAVGGYKVIVRKRCPIYNGYKLYLYIGNDPKNVKPGDLNTYHIFGGIDPMDTNYKYKRVIYSVNGDNAGTVDSYGNVIMGNVPPVTNGRLYFAIKDGDKTITAKSKIYSDLKDNFNYYNISFIKTNTDAVISKIYSSFINGVYDVLYGELDANGLRVGGVLGSFRDSMIRNGIVSYIAFVLYLYLVIFTLSYIAGIVEFNKFDLIIRIAKIIIVIMCTGAGAYSFFMDALIKFFTDGMHELVRVFVSSSGIAADTDFAFLDKIFVVIFNEVTWIKFFSLIFTTVFGIISFFIIIYTVWTFIKSVVDAMISVTVIVITTIIMLSLTPIFIMTLLFNATKYLYEAWFKMLIYTAIYPILLLSLLAMLVEVFSFALHAVTSYKICTGCMIKITGDDLSYETTGGMDTEICFIKVLQPTTYDRGGDIKQEIKFAKDNGNDASGIPFSFAKVILFLIIGQAIGAAGQIAEGLTRAITGSMASIGTRGGHAIGQAILSTVGLDDETQGEISHAIKNRDYYVQRGRIEFKGKEADGENPENSSSVEDAPRTAPETYNSESDDKPDSTNSSNSSDSEANQHATSSPSSDSLQMNDRSLPSISDDDNNSISSYHTADNRSFDLTDFGDESPFDESDESQSFTQIDGEAMNENETDNFDRNDGAISESDYNDRDDGNQLSGNDVSIKGDLEVDNVLSAGTVDSKVDGTVDSKVDSTVDSNQSTDDTTDRNINNNYFMENTNDIASDAPEDDDSDVNNGHNDDSRSRDSGKKGNISRDSDSFGSDNDDDHNNSRK